MEDRTRIYNFQDVRIRQENTPLKTGGAASPMSLACNMLTVSLLAVSCLVPQLKPSTAHALIYTAWFLAGATAYDTASAIMGQRANTGQSWLVNDLPSIKDIQLRQAGTCPAVTIYYKDGSIKAMSLKKLLESFQANENAISRVIGAISGLEGNRRPFLEIRVGKNIDISLSSKPISGADMPDILEEKVKSLQPKYLEGTPILAVDFDGVLAEGHWPDAKNPNLGLIKKLLWLREEYNAKLILWTCRTGEALKKAITLCQKNGLEFDSINENLPEILEQFHNVDSRKITADLYVDDQCFLMQAYRKQEERR